MIRIAILCGALLVGLASCVPPPPTLHRLGRLPPAVRGAAADGCAAPRADEPVGARGTRRTAVIGVTHH